MPSFSPYGRINQVPVEQVFDATRYLMFRWGFIGAFRADNGAPFGEPTRQALSVLNLCLSGYGIRIKLNPPRSPRKNAKVERNQGTTSRWADVKACNNYLEFQEQLNRAVIDQREHFQTRVCANRTRAQCYPQLFSNPKRFNVACFYQHFIYDLLAKGSWQRKISKDGSTYLFGKTYQVGTKHRDKTTTATFNPTLQEWVFKDQNGQFLKNFKANNISEKNLRNLSLRQ